MELARLQLLRGAKAASDGDAEEAQRNAQRAAATDASRPLSRVIIALTQSHRMLESIARAQPAMRGARLDVLQQLVEASLPAAEGAEAAVLHSLVGFIQLDRGDADGAKASFLTALTLFPKFAAAELGAGDAARASGDFAGAQAAYERCLHLDPSNPDAELGLDAVAKRTKLQLNRLPPPPSGMPTLDQAPLANVGASANPCSAAERKATPTLCKAVAELRKPRDDEGLKQASRLVLDEVLAQDCMKQRTQCGEQIPRAVLEAARAFARGKDWPKVIVAARVALSNPSFSKVQQDALLLTADAFYTIGVTSMAASFYGKYAAGAPQDEKAALRGFLLQLVELDADAVRTQAVALGRNLRIPQETRAAVMQLSEMLQPEAHESGRATALGISRGIRAIIADPSWSPAHGR